MRIVRGRLPADLLPSPALTVVQIEDDEPAIGRFAPEGELRISNAIDRTEVPDLKFFLC